MLPDTPSSGLVVLVPEAEPVVAQLRRRLDPSAALGVAAHVTVLFPFAAPDTIDSGVVHRLRDLFSRVPAFPYTFDRTAWFGDQVLWLAPTDDRPFRELTRLVHAAFPAYPPFGGAFPDPVPHLTVGNESPVDRLRAADSELAEMRPLHGRATSVTLLVQSDPGCSFRVHESFALG